MDQISPDRLRYWWWVRQGLNRSLEGVAPAEILSRAGWARSVSGASPCVVPDSEMSVALLAEEDLDRPVMEDNNVRPLGGRCEYDPAGDVRSFSLDSPKARAPRFAKLREAAAG